MTAEMRVQSLDILRERLKSFHAAGMTWREIACEFAGVPPGTLCAIVKGREPRKPDVRKALGLPEIVRVTGCLRCGQVHVSRRCTHRRRAYRDLFSIPPGELTRMIRERVEVTDL